MTTTADGLRHLVNVLAERDPWLCYDFALWCTRRALVQDGVPLNELLERDESNRRENRQPFTYILPPYQRDAVSAHWSSALRSRVSESAERENNRIVVDLDD